MNNQTVKRPFLSQRLTDVTKFLDDNLVTACQELLDYTNGAQPSDGVLDTAMSMIYDDGGDNSDWKVSSTIINTVYYLAVRKISREKP